MKHARLLLALLLSGCGSDRARPDPFGPHNPVILTVEVITPLNNETVRAGSPLTVRVRGSERGERLVGLGFYARRAATLDSVTVSFSTKPDSLHEFTFNVPRELGTNTQIDLFGLAFGAFGEVLRSNVHTVIVIGCGPGNPCQ